MPKHSCVCLTARVMVSFAVFLQLLLLPSCSGSSSSSATSLNQGGGGTTPGNPVGPNLILLSSDPYTVGPGQHATEVEPHMLANGSRWLRPFKPGESF